MKTLFAILGLCIVGILARATDEERAKSRAKFENDKDACIKEIGVDPALADNTLNGKMDQKYENMGCFMACIAKKYGMINADGSINESKLKVRGSVKKERAAAVVNKCKAMKGADDCETALKVVDCMYKEDGW